MIDQIIQPARDPGWLQWAAGAVAGLVLLLISIFGGAA